jgi:aspartate/methionine/tyrosine aminotransferase
MPNQRTPYLVWMKEKLRATRNTDIVNLASSGVTTEFANRWQDEVLRKRSAEILSRSAEPNEYGLESLQIAIRKAFGVPQNRQVVLTSGASGGIRLVCEVLLAGRSDAEVIVEAPTYEPLWAIPARLGAKVHFIERSKLATLAQHISANTVAVFLSNLHNPTGHWLDPIAFAELVRSVENSGTRAAIVADETYLDIGPQREKTAASLGRHVVTISSLSKSHGLPALRCGWVSADPEFLPDFLSDSVLFQNVGLKVGEIISAMAVEELDAFRQAARSHVERNRILIDAWLRETADAGLIEPQPTPHGCIVFPQLTRSTPTIRLAEQLEHEHGVLVVPGKFFGDDYDNHLRISFSGEHDQLQRGLNRLSEGVAALLSCGKD